MENALATLLEPNEHRQATRTHLFVVATLCWNEGSGPVHVRNMSATGALVEADALPGPGRKIVLKRGSLEVGGHIAWVASRQAGLAFSPAVRETDWMGRRANAHQERIDEIVAALKAESAADEPSAEVAEPSPYSVEIESELALLGADLMRLGEALTADVILVATHPEIQLIDIALQRVERIMAASGQRASSRLGPVNSPS